MIVRITSTGEVVLDEAADCKRLSVDAADRGRAGGRLTAAGAGAPLDADHVEIDVAWLRAGAAGQATPADLDAMLAYAGSKGWLSADGLRVRAHLA
jgi:hypothetical protein